MFEVTAQTLLRQPKPRPLPIPAGTPWLDLNGHTLFKPTHKTVTTVHETLEEFYAQSASRGSSTSQALFGLSDTAELVAQMRQYQHRRPEPPPYYEVMDSAV